jgi:hypothetical protein
MRGVSFLGRVGRYNDLEEVAPWFLKETAETFHQHSTYRSFPSQSAFDAMAERSSPTASL